MNYGIIYKAISPSGKVYVGQTIRDLDTRIKSHFYDAFNKSGRYYNKKFSKAIRKYGSQIKWEILYRDVPLDKLNELETVEIKNYNSIISGYNCTSGGEGLRNYRHSEESKRKMSLSRLGSKRSLETRTKMSNSKMGHILIEETKKKISNSLKGKKASIETRRKMSKSRVGKIIKEYYVETPVGNIEKIMGIFNLEKYCLNKKINFGSLMSHKKNFGYKILKSERVTN